MRHPASVIAATVSFIAGIVVVRRSDNPTNLQSGLALIASTNFAGGTS